jgi:hypothetical protein
MRQVALTVHTMTNITEHVVRVVAFDNLGGDSLPDVRGVSSPKEMEEVAPPPPPFIPSRHLR